MASSIEFGIRELGISGKFQLGLKLMLGYPGYTEAGLITFCTHKTQFITWQTRSTTAISHTKQGTKFF
jgi:hypothetical protein